MSWLPPPARNGTLGEVGPFLQGSHEEGYLRRVVRAVCVDHDDEVTGGCGKAAGQGVSLPLTALADNGDVRSQALRHADGVVGRVPIDEDHFTISREILEDVRQVLRLVLGRNHDADGGLRILRSEDRADPRQRLRRPRLQTRFCCPLSLSSRWMARPSPYRLAIGTQHRRPSSAKSPLDTH